MSSLSISLIQRALSQHKPSKITGHQALRYAAVAMIFHAPEMGSIELLLIQRSKNPNDRWSGHMAFPGGRVDPEDPNSLAAAIRETKEEVGLDLRTHGTHFGQLSQLMATAQGKTIPMVVQPFPFVLDSRPPLTPNEEVSEIVWIPFTFFLDDANRTTMPYKYGGVSMQLPCYHFQDKTVWGLTLKMIDEMRECVLDQMEKEC